MSHYDILFAGGGLSGLTLALELARRPYFQDKTICLLDRDEKQRNDRTWCFWSDDDEMLPPVVYKTWDHALFFGAHLKKNLDIAPFRYNMVRGIDFYNWAIQELDRYPNVHRIRANISGLEAEAGIVHTDSGDYSGNWVFNSAFTPVAVLPKADSVYAGPPLSVLERMAPEAGSHTFLLQHFKGWVIQTPQAAFDPGTATLMDFRIDQKGDTRFVYVLPFSETEALVEFTSFSPALFPKEEYENELRQYIRKYLDIGNFTIKDEEFGVIPMSDYPFWRPAEGRTIHIGTAGGFVKGSSGYAFKRTQRKARAFAEAWAQTGVPDPGSFRSPLRFRIYDSIMLRVLREGHLSGQALFTDLFRKLPAPLVFRFLDEDSTFADELRLIFAPAAGPFLRAAWRQLRLSHKI